VTHIDQSDLYRRNSAVFKNLLHTRPGRARAEASARWLDTYAAHVILRWTRSDSARVIVSFTFLPHSLVPMSIWPGTKGKRANVIPSTGMPWLAHTDEGHFLLSPTL